MNQSSSPYVAAHAITEARTQTLQPTKPSFFKRAWGIWQVVRTRIWWGSRLHHLGKRTRLASALMVNNAAAVSIADYVTISRDFVLADLRPGEGILPKITIGEGSTILYRFQCNAAQSITIGRNVLIASNVLITDSDHVVEPGGIPVTKSTKLITRPVRIGDNCWLGQNVVILKGVTIGDDCIIGANSVVHRDVPSRSVAAGNPAKVVKVLESVSITPSPLGMGRG